jgi:methylated-DNA-[protein]-cysteine S-methyltransferase
MIVEWNHMDTPVGQITVAAHGGRLVALKFEGGWRRGREHIERNLPGYRFERTEDPAGAISRLRRYFGGEPGAFVGLEVELFGTKFQKAVWRQLRRIPAGQTRSYGEIAVAIGEPNAVRAVGAANGANPVAIVVPCHRVIGADGKLTGFGGGIPRKRWLLDHESAQLRMPGARASRAA